MRHKPPSSPQAVLPPAPAGLLGISKAARRMRSFHFTFRMETFLFPPHYHYDILYNKGL